jgi:hypothetical protein
MYTFLAVVLGLYASCGVEPSIIRDRVAVHENYTVMYFSVATESQCVCYAEKYLADPEHKLFIPKGKRVTLIETIPWHTHERAEDFARGCYANYTVDPIQDTNQKATR